MVTETPGREVSNQKRVANVICSERIEIHAPIHLVWDLLVDLERYEEWNPFTYRMEGSLQEGASIKLSVRLGGKDRTEVEQIKEVSKPHKLSWGMKLGASFLLVSLREQCLEDASDESCYYTTTQTFGGLLAPLVRFLVGRHIRTGFDEMSNALKKRAEMIFQEQS